MADAAAPLPPGPSKKKRRRRLVLRLVALLMALVFCAIGCELFVLVVYGEQPKFPRHVVGAPWGLRYNEPGAVYRHKSADITVWFHINGQGMRAERDYPYEKPPGVKRIISLGDSYTVGYEVEREESFNCVLERSLTARGIQAEVLNCGVSGYSNAEELLYLEKELLRYHPDLVLLTWCSNDLSDNTRTGLFKVDDQGALIQLADHYVPAEGLGDFLNQNALFSLLSERSNAFCFLKERLTRLVKREMVKAAQRDAAAVEGTGLWKDEDTPEAIYQRRLCIAIFERLYQRLQKEGIPLVIQTIPSRVPKDDSLIERFPKDFDVKRDGVVFVSGKEFLDQYAGKELLYYRRSHWHWTPLAHRASGECLAGKIVEKKLLE